MKTKKILVIAFGLALGLTAVGFESRYHHAGNFAASTVEAAVPADAEGSASETSMPDPDRITKGPVVSNVTVSSASVAWITESASPTEVRYSSDGKHWRTALKPTEEHTHVVNIARLYPDTSYQFRIMTRDHAVSSSGAFRTLAK